MKDKMIVKKVKIHKEGWINVWFEKRGKKAEFDYDFEGDEAGICNCNYQEDDDEDIYEDIHNWVAKNIRKRPSISLRSKI